MHVGTMDRRLLYCRLLFECKRPLILYHNIIKIHNNVMWDIQYYVEYSSIQAKCDEYLVSCMLLMNNLYQIARNPSSDHVC